MMRTLSSIIIVIAAFSQSKAQETLSYSLDQCIDYALEHNQTVVNAEYDKEIADTQVNETIGLGLPQINLSSGLNYNYEIQQILLPPFNDPEGEEVPLAFGQTYDGNVVLSASQLIFDGSFFVGLQAAKTVRELSSKAHIKTQIDVAEAVSKAYYNALVNEERLALLEVNYRRLDTLLNETSALYESGFAEKIDVSRVKVQVNNIKVQYDKTKQLLDLSKDLLKFQMGLRMTDEVILTDELDAVDFAVIDKSDFDYTQRIEYSQLQSNLNLVNLDMKNNRVQYLPSLYANFNYGYNTNAGRSSVFFEGDRWFDFGTLGLSFNLPVFDGFIKRSRIQRNKIEARQIQQSFTQLESSIDIEIKESQINLTNAIENMVAQKENTELAKEIYDVSKIKYEEGVGSSIEVTNADADYKEAQTNYYDALYSALVAKVELEKAYGELIK